MHGSVAKSKRFVIPNGLHLESAIPGVQSHEEAQPLLGVYLERGCCQQLHVGPLRCPMAHPEAHIPV